MRDFKTAAKAAVTDEDSFKFKVNDVEVVSLRPSEGQIAMLLAAQASEIRSDNSRIAGIIDGALALFDEDSRRIIGQMLHNGDLPFDSEDGDSFMDIMVEVIEEWAERPTKLSSDSTSSSEGSGVTSTDGASLVTSGSSASA